MTDPNSFEARAELEANELRLWVSPGEVGLWCSACASNSGYTFTIQRDPAEPSDSWAWRCVNDPTHRFRGITDA